jgi:hypothetical protein
MNKRPCSHSIEERAFTSSWCCVEIGYALQLGYQILETYEAYIYEQNQPIFKHFLEELGKYKVGVKTICCITLQHFSLRYNIPDILKTVTTNK